MGLRRLAAALLLVAVTTGACGDDQDPRPTTQSWPTTQDPLAVSGLVWARGSEVHLGDADRTLDVGSQIATFVVAGDGVFFTRQSDEPGDGSYGGSPEQADRPLYYSEGTGRPIRVAPSAGSLRASPDGRYLAFLDLATGTKDQVGTAQIQTVVVDLTTGKEVVRSAQGMGDPSSDDLGAVYPESPPRLIKVDDRTAYVAPFHGDVLAFDLGTGKATTVAADAAQPPYQDGRNDPGTWRILDPLNDRDRFQPEHGRAVAPSGVPGKIGLGFWLDDSTALGYALTQPGTPLLTCVVPSGRCTEVPGTRGDHIVYEGGLDPTP